MLVMSIDTCCGPFSVVIKHNDKILSQIIEIEENKQAELLVITIEKALKEAHIVYEDISLLVVTNGPGSFTGIRAGLAAVYAIATIENIPCIGITTLEILAHQLINNIIDELFYITVAAGRGRYYCQLFNRSPYAISKVMLIEHREVGDLNYNVYGDYREKCLIDTSVLADLGLIRFTGNVDELPKAIYE